MLSASELEKLKRIASEIADREGCRLYDVEIGGSAQGRTIRVFIEKKSSDDSKAHVSIDDCSNVSRALNLRLDVEDLVPGGSYILEISSPGLERSLREPWHFQGALGGPVWVKFRRPLMLEGRSFKQISGDLEEVKAGGIVIKTQGRAAEVAFEDIEKAKTVFDFAREQSGPSARADKKRQKRKKTR